MTLQTYSSEDTAELVSELFACLRSPAPALKQVSSSCIFRITKICTQPLEKKLLQEKLQEALLEFKTRKNSKVPRKFFEEYLVRFPDLALDTLAESMMSGCLDAKSPYQQTECCELISAVLRRFKTLSVPSQAVLFDKFSVFLHSLAQSAQALVTTRVATGEGSGNGNGNGSSVIVAGKRLKVFLGCIKDVLVIIKQKVKLSGEVAEVSPALVASLASLRDLVDAKGLISAHLQSDLKNGLNASLNVLCQQSKQLVDELGPLKTKKESSGKRKENASTGNHQDGEVVFKQKKVKKSKQ